MNSSDPLKTQRNRFDEDPVEGRAAKLTKQNVRQADPHKASWGPIAFFVVPICFSQERSFGFLFFPKRDPKLFYFPLTPEFKHAHYKQKTYSLPLIPYLTVGERDSVPQLQIFLCCYFHKFTQLTTLTGLVQAIKGVSRQNF